MLWGHYQGRPPSTRALLDCLHMPPRPVPLTPQPRNIARSQACPHTLTWPTTLSLMYSFPSPSGLASCGRNKKFEFSRHVNEYAGTSLLAGPCQRLQKAMMTVGVRLRVYLQRYQTLFRYVQGVAWPPPKQRGPTGTSGTPSRNMARTFAANFEIVDEGKRNWYPLDSFHPLCQKSLSIAYLQPPLLWFSEPYGHLFFLYIVQRFSPFCHLLTKMVLYYQSLIHYITSHR